MANASNGAANGGASTTTPGADAGHDLRFDDATEARLERAVDETDFEGAEDLIHEATLRLLDDVLDEDGALECPHDDCDRTFATIRERRGHLGSSEHALDVPDGDFWCGYCGYGPTTWRGINSHHGSSDHDGDPVRLDEEPDREDLIAPDDVPDHKNPELLEELYQRHDGNYTEMCRQHDFEVSPGRVRHYLVEFGIHDPTPQGPTEDGEGPLYRDPEWLQERYDAADGNVSEMHRRIEDGDEVDVPYRTLLKNLKRLGIHDPTESPGRGQAWEQRESDQDEDAVAESGGDEEDDEPAGLDHTDPEDLQAAFNKHDTLSDAAEEFSQVSYQTVRQRMIDHGIYEPDSYDTSSDEPSPAEPESEPDPGSDSEHTDEPEPEPQPEPTVPDEESPESQLGVDDPAAVDSFHDLDTPDWLDEASFYQAVEMSDDVEELAEVLGWKEYERLELIVDLLDVDVAIPAGGAV